MKRLWDRGGYRTAIAGQAIMTGGIVFFIALGALEMSRAKYGEPRYLAAAIAAFAGEFLCLPYLSFRPVTLALLILAIVAWLIVRDRRMGKRSRAVWLVIPLAALLANVHLYAVFVPLAVLACVICIDSTSTLNSSGGTEPRRARRSQRESKIEFWRISGLGSCICSATSAPSAVNFLLFFGSCIACLLTPMLPGVIGAAWHYQFADVMVSGQIIAEMRPFYHGPLGWAAAGIVLAILAGAIVNRRSLQMYQWIWLLGSLGALLRMGRFAPIFAIFAAPTLAVTLPRLSDAVLWRPITRVVLAIVLILGSVRVALAFPAADEPMSIWVNRMGADFSGYPTVAADFVERNVPARTHRLINEFTWGGYLEWRLGPNYQALMDGRTQLFSADFWNQVYLGTPAARKCYLAALDADAAVLPVKGSEFRQDLLDLGWRVIFSDDRAMVLVPPEATSRRRIEQCTAAPGNAS